MSFSSFSLFLLGLGWDNPGARSPKMAPDSLKRGSCWFKDVTWLFSTSTIHFCTCWSSGSSTRCEQCSKGRKTPQEFCAILTHGEEFIKTAKKNPSEFKSILFLFFFFSSSFGIFFSNMIWIQSQSSSEYLDFLFEHRIPPFPFAQLITLLACFCSIFTDLLVYLYLPIYNDFRAITHSSTRKHYISQFTIAIMISVRNKCSCL